MRKMPHGAFWALCACLLFSQPAYAQAAAPDVMSGTVLSLMTPTVFAAIEDYYGEPRLYWPDSDRIVSVKRLPDTAIYEIVIEVETFYGPHNPPYGIETMTFHVNQIGETKLVAFRHQDKPA